MELEKLKLGINQLGGKLLNKPDEDESEDSETWECKNCGEEYDTKKEAEECCEDDKEDSEPEEEEQPVKPKKRQLI